MSTDAVRREQVPNAETAGLALPYSLASLAIVAIWVSVVLCAIYAPDFVSGTQQQHLASGWLDWIWGGIATGFVAMTAMEGIRARVTSRAPWVVLGVTVGAVWMAVAVSSIFTPRMITGTDPTMIPYAAWGSPILGLIATWFITTFVGSMFKLHAAPPGTAPAGDPDVVARLNQVAALRDAGTITAEEFEKKKSEILARL